MRLKFVTITGFSENDGINLLFLSSKYSYMEAGFLQSMSQCGRGRYPSQKYIEAISHETTFKRSLHICGSAAVAASTRGISKEYWNEINKLCSLFDRVQLNRNFSDYTVEDPDSYVPFIRAIDPIPVIIQYNKNNEHAWEDVFRHLSNTHVLFDGSGGQGKLGAWQEPIYPGKPHGYAGGLNPRNIDEQLRSIARVAGDAEVYFDVESGVRDRDNKFDVVSAVKMLEAAKPYLGADRRG